MSDRVKKILEFLNSKNKPTMNESEADTSSTNEKTDNDPEVMEGSADSNSGYEDDEDADESGDPYDMPIEDDDEDDVEDDFTHDISPKKSGKLFGSHQITIKIGAGGHGGKIK